MKQVFYFKTFAATIALISISLTLSAQSKTSSKTTKQAQAKTKGAVSSKTTSPEAKSKSAGQVRLSDIKGTYVCVSGGVPELLADGTISKASVDAAKQTMQSYSSALKYLFRGDGTFADLTYGDKYASDPKYNGTYKIEDGKMNMYSSGILFFTFQPAINAEGKVALIQVHEPKNRYKAQFCQVVN